MNFSFDDQQLEFRSQLRSVLDRECTPAALRAAFDRAASGALPDRARWGRLAEMGVVGMTAPEARGGLGLGLVDLIGLLEEAGRAGLPEPLSETTAVVVPLLVRLSEGGANAVASGSRPDASAKAGHADGQPDRIFDRILDRIVVGELIATVVTDPAAGVWVDGADLMVVAQPERVLLGFAADVRTTRVGCLDATRRLGTVDTPLVASDWTVLAEGPTAEAAFADVELAGCVSAASVLLGVADRLIELACDHARNRHQFGAPIGSFQAVKHLIANAYVALEMARPVVYAAACELDSAGAGGYEAPTVAGASSSVQNRRLAHDDGALSDDGAVARSCSMAKAVASEAALKAAAAALQVHGAIGYTWEHDLHFWMKRAWFLAASWGDARTHYAKVLESLIQTA